MKIKLLLVALLFMPVLFGCSKESQFDCLIGEWYLSWEREYRMYSPEYVINEAKEYDKYNTPSRLILYESGEFEVIYRGDNSREGGEWTIFQKEQDPSYYIKFNWKSENGFMRSGPEYNLFDYRKDRLVLRQGGDDPLWEIRLRYEPY